MIYFIWILIIFIICLLFDVVIAPAVLVSYFGFLIIIFFISLILSNGLNRRLVFYLTTFGLIYEFMASYYLGTVVLALLINLGLLFLLNHFINLNMFFDHVSWANYFLAPVLGGAMFWIIIYLMELNLLFLNGQSLLDFVSKSHYGLISFHIYLYVAVFSGNYLLRQVFNAYAQRRI